VGPYSKLSLRVNYVFRPKLHERIKEGLHNRPGDERTQSSKVLVVWGLGGAGKSQLVLTYLQEYRTDYSNIFWVEAGTKEAIEQEYLQIYGLLYPRHTGADQEAIRIEGAIPGVKNWFHGKEWTVPI